MIDVIHIVAGNVNVIYRQHNSLTMIISFRYDFDDGKSTIVFVLHPPFSNLSR